MAWGAWNPPSGKHHCLKPRQALRRSRRLKVGELHRASSKKCMDLAYFSIYIYILNVTIMFTSLDAVVHGFARFSGQKTWVDSGCRGHHLTGILTGSTTWNVFGLVWKREKTGVIWWFTSAFKGNYLYPSFRQTWLSLSIFLSIYLQYLIYLSIYPSIHPSVCRSPNESWKQSCSARLSPNLKLQSWKLPFSARLPLNLTGGTSFDHLWPICGMNPVLGW
jgi:hypothetical protein